MLLFSLFLLVLGVNANMTNKTDCPIVNCVTDGSVDYFPHKVITSPIASLDISLTNVFPSFKLGQLRGLYVS